MAKEMRGIFGEALRDLGAENEKVVVLDADLSGATKSATFGAAYPDRFYNIGIAEANMVSIAAGMASCDLIPYACTFSFLLALRSLDQIRSQICCPKLNVKLVGTNGGLSGFGDGATHQSTNDLAIMTSLPNMHVIVPSDEATARWAIRGAAEVEGPVFVRIARVPAPDFHTNTDFVFGRSNVLREGTDVTILAMGLMTAKALEAADLLAGQGISAEVLESLTLKPFDRETLAASAAKTGAVVTAEEHSRYGGLFSVASETLSETSPVPVLPVAIEDRFGETGTYDQLLGTLGLTADHIVSQALRAIGMKKS